MALLQQLIQLLSQPPGTAVYHLVTLFALQATFGVALNQWNRNRQDSFAFRLWVAAAAIFLLRLAFFILTLLLASNATAVRNILPPLDQLAHAATAVFLIWALVFYTPRLPRLPHALLPIVLLLLGLIYAVYAPQWPAIAQTGELYNGTVQATIWGGVQIGLLLLGVLWGVFNGRFRTTLRPFPLLLLLIAHVIHFWNYPELIPTGSDIAYWIRLGHLAAFPLLAVIAYRHSQQAILAQAAQNRHTAEQFSTAFRRAALVIETTDLQKRLNATLQLAADLMEVPFVGIALFRQANPNQLALYHNQPQTRISQPYPLPMTIADWQPFTLAIEQNSAVSLRPDQIGQEQLQNLYQTIGLTPLGPMLVQPLRTRSRQLGLLLLAGPEGRESWSDAERLRPDSFADYIAQAIINTQRHAAPPAPATPEIDLSHYVSLEERNTLQRALEDEATRARTAEKAAVLAQQREKDLVAAVAALEAELSKQAQLASATVEKPEPAQDDPLETPALPKLFAPDTAQIELLEAELETLRESLISAEEALAVAAAGDSGLSAEWAMLTITRYSSQLEEAQATIEQLEAELSKHGSGPGDEVVFSLAQELRTPMTSIAGYTDLLLAERIGLLGTKQRDFLQRVRANVNQMGKLLDQIVQLTTVKKQPVRPAKEQVSIREAVETAVSTISPSLRQKNLRLNLNLGQDMPNLRINSNALNQILSNLLNNATLATPNEGRIGVQAQHKQVELPTGNGHPEFVHYLQIDVRDSGSGISAADRPFVFDPHHRADRPLIEGLGDTGAGMAVARTLAEANGGRIWVTSQQQEGSTFTLLFPAQQET